MITPEELAKEIHLIDDINHDFAMMIAVGLLPYIERHIAERELAAATYAVDEMQRTGTPPAIQSRAAGVQGADELLRSENPDRKDFTVDEALRIADQNDAAYKHAPSVSRTLAAEVRRLATPQPPKDAGSVPARYFADGPEGFFFADDLKLARAILDVYDESQDWTITDTQHPPAEPAARAQVGEPDDIAVDRFADAMKAKMAAARAKGRGGWEGPTCNAEILSRMLRDHVEKGDPLDVANFCMMLWNRGEVIEPSSTRENDNG